MGKSKSESRSLLRLIFWEGMALAGFLHVHLHPIANPFWDLNFFYNALFFLLAYPILYVYRWKFTDGCLSTILWPLSFLFSWGLGVSGYLWMTYILFVSGSPYYFSMMNHVIILGVLFAFIYFPLVQPILGTSKNYYTLGALVGVLFYSALGCLLGFLLGQFVDHKFGASIGLDSRRFLLWLALILIGTAIGALVAKRGEKG